MKIILLRDKGVHSAVQVSRRRFVVLAVTAVSLLISATVWISVSLQPDGVDAQVVAQWRAKLANQRDLVAAVEQKSQHQSAAVGRQLAQMQARLLRMEAIGAHMTDAAGLKGEEFNPHAQACNEVRSIFNKLELTTAGAEVSSSPFAQGSTRALVACSTLQNMRSLLSSWTPSANALQCAGGQASESATEFSINHCKQFID